MIQFRIVKPAGEGAAFDDRDYWLGVQQRAGRQVLAAALILEGNIKRKLSQPGRGRIYRRRNITHRASAPGDPPAPDTGRLRASIGHNGPKVTANDATAEVGTNVVYARFLERGGRTPSGAYVAPRPYMGPAVAESEAAMDAALAAI